MKDCECCNCPHVAEMPVEMKVGTIETYNTGVDYLVTVENTELDIVTTSQNPVLVEALKEVNSKAQTIISAMDEA